MIHDDHHFLAKKRHLYGNFLCGSSARAVSSADAQERQSAPVRIDARRKMIPFFAWKDEIMFKVMWLMKRKENTSKSDLIAYYENHHSLLGKKLFEDNGIKPIKYMRKYFHSATDIFPFAETISGTDFDLAMEMWFESREDFERLIEVSSPEETWKMIREDADSFLDPHKRAIFILEEHETEFD